MTKQGKALVAVAVAIGLGLGLAAVRVGRARSGLAELLLWMPPDIEPSERARHMADAAGRIVGTVHVAAPLFACTSLLACLVLVFAGAASFGRRLAAVGTLLFALGAAAAWLSNRELFTSGHGCGVPCLHEALLRAQHWETRGKLAIGVGAALCWVVLVVRAYAEARRSRAAPRGTLLASTLLLLGGTAFAATRGHAWDAQHPMPPDDPNANIQACYASLSDEARLASLPSAVPGCEAANGPVVEQTLQGIVLDGSVAPDPAQLQATLKAKRELWQMLNPDRPFPGVLLFAAPRSATTQQLLPWLAAAERAGYPKLGIYLQAPPLRLATKTVGSVTKLRCCSTVWQLDASATTALTSWQTWGELSAATSRPERKLALR